MAREKEAKRQSEIDLQDRLAKIEEDIRGIWSHIGRVSDAVKPPSIVLESYSKNEDGTIEHRINALET